MGVFITVLFLFLSYLSPVDVMPSIAPYRPLLMLAGLAALASLLSIGTNPRLVQFVTGLPQFWLMLLLFGMIPFSRVARGWISGGLYALPEFGILAGVFFFVVFGVYKRPHYTFLRAALIASALYVSCVGIAAYYYGYGGETYLYEQKVWLEQEGEWDQIGYYRVRGAGSLGDPNDTAQMLIVTLPFIWSFWRKGSFPRNIIAVLFPAAVVLWAIGLTRSRGALLAGTVMLLLAFRRRLGTVGAAIISGVLAVGLLAVGFSGGRGISVGEGQGRLEAWSAGLSMFKSSPIWGVGYNTFKEHHPITAHNSFLLCLAELGLVGTFAWLGLWVVSFIRLGVLAKQFAAKATEHDLWVLRMAAALRLSITGFLVTSWFLSRTYAITGYVLMAAVVALEVVAYRIGEHTQPARVAAHTDSAPKRNWFPVTVGVELFGIALVYVLVNLRH